MTAQLSLHSRVVAAPEHVACDVAGQILILSLKDGVYYGLDPVGAQIWELLKEQRTIAELRDEIMRRYEVEAERCAGDVIELLEQMREWNLVEVLAPPEE
ncbi:MAG TPA: PqqD family peptide modification chaperone [Longimicrobiaceae bacterium]|nr:PqqD family peptide modification chaperone [Longimicrobiaceae bacterium]